MADLTYVTEVAARAELSEVNKIRAKLGRKPLVWENLPATVKVEFSEGVLAIVTALNDAGLLREG